LKIVIPVIILNWNGINDTIKSVNSVLNQTYKNFRIYLVDNNSDNDEGLRLENLFKSNEKIKVIHFEDNFGFTKAHNFIFNNFILNNDNYNFVALLNNDAFADKNWLETLVKTAEKTNANIISSKMIQYFDKYLLDNAGHLMLNTAEIVPIGYDSSINKHNNSKSNFGACGGACLYNVKMLKEIGVFDSNFTTGYEDAELGVRAIVCGYNSIYEPNAIVHHKGGQSLNKVRNEAYHIQIQRNIFYSYFKLMPTMVILINLPFFILKYSLVLIIDIVFRRRKYFNRMWKAIKHTIIDDRKKIIIARQQFHKKFQTISSYSIMKKTTFFLWFDIKRFYKYIILKPKY